MLLSVVGKDSEYLALTWLYHHQCIIICWHYYVILLFEQKLQEQKLFIAKASALSKNIN
jgi:hypothetical protein